MLMNKKSLGIFFVWILFVSAVAGIQLGNVAKANFLIPESLPEIEIKGDGSLNPSTGLIRHEGNVYYLTDDIIGEYSLTVRCNNIVVDGENHTINGKGAGGFGIYLEGITNVIVRNIEVTDFPCGILLRKSSNCVVIRANITNNSVGVALSESNNNIISENRINNRQDGIRLDMSHYNEIRENIIVGNYNAGITLTHSQLNSIQENNITDSFHGVLLADAFDNEPRPNATSNNKIYLNNLVNNSVHVFFGYPLLENSWDNGKEGNFWSDYNGTDSNGDGIGDTPYVIDESNIDNYPLMTAVDINNITMLPPPEPFPAPLVVASAVSIVVVGLGLLFYFKRSHH
jgi:nitrous oxidase accessory protein